MNYIFSKKSVEIGDRGFIVGNRFIGNKKSYPKYSYPIGISNDNISIINNNNISYNEWIIYASYINVEGTKAIINSFYEHSRFTAAKRPPFEMLRIQNTKEKVLIRRYTIGTGGENGYYNRCIRDFSLEGSDDALEWIKIDERTNLFGNSTPNKNTTIEFEIDNDMAFYYHRIYVTRNYGNSETRIGGFTAFSK